MVDWELILERGFLYSVGIAIIVAILGMQRDEEEDEYDRWLKWRYG